MNLKMDSDKAKLFIGGISRDTTEDILKNHFTKYGDVLYSTVSLDRTTRIPRGFGFVTFSDISSAHEALQDTHVILGRTVEVKKAIPRGEQQHQNQLQNRGGNNYNNYECSNDHIRTKKIFVGGLPANISEVEFKRYFERFGRITDVVVMQDSVTHRPRGFGFITFDSEESVQNVMVKTFHDLNGSKVEVKRAVPREENAGYDGFNKIRYNSDRGAAETFPHSSPSNMFPGFAPSPLPWYGNDGVYGYGSTNAYGCWYPMGGYAGNVYVAPSDISRNFWYGQMVPAPQVCQVPYFNTNVAYMGSSVGIVGSAAGSWGYHSIPVSATNLKFDHPFTANGFVQYNLPSPHVVKQGVGTSIHVGINGGVSS
ncbi:heterogeneous nuclear ribonucleoprotein 1-like [Cicer arietinum]|uniref:Heterogeneous nuclear ribonucleoprotein 1-like n=1 Tax=Cicer arietinum TaxID=3827 RepID=A0A1S2Y9G5_CICAR|nr:heterogeneous nuclear ribonucleoprotein 1-like [Cicer arietinum]XP_004501501.1 heterogeneous nuclear ribonucleoprotein 1-like [Cicer arietinum]XP_004501502.1 heterogeneous nuclear ribonucleoprotein 1-like [Cicer arietinum]